MRQELSSAANCIAGQEHPKTPACSAETRALLVEVQLAKLKLLGQTVTPNVSGCSLIPKGGLGVCRQQFFASRLRLLFWSCSRLSIHIYSRSECSKSFLRLPDMGLGQSAKLNERLPDLCFAICRFSQVRFITPSHLTHNLFFYFQ